MDYDLQTKLCLVARRTRSTRHNAQHFHFWPVGHASLPDCNCHENGESLHEKSTTYEQLAIFMLSGAPDAHATCRKQAWLLRNHSADSLGSIEWFLRSHRPLDSEPPIVPSTEADSRRFCTGKGRRGHFCRRCTATRQRINTAHSLRQLRLHRPS